LTRIAQILVAAGKGARIGGEVPKQYRLIGGKTVLRRTIEATHFQPRISETVVVVAHNDSRINDYIADLDKVRAVTGGATRTASVSAGLAALADNPPDLVLIHDGARPFVTSDVIDGVIEALSDTPAAVPALPIADALKSLEGASVDREQLRRVQTPQGFHFDKIWAAFQSLDDDASFADDIEVAQMAGLKIAFTQGDTDNFKVTYPEDFAKAEAMLTTETYTATGTGFDVHRFTEGDVMWLCGVPIECGFTLLGHSDADAGLHALTDAILGAIAIGDIGDHFPPSDPKWKGASSDKFLKFAIEQVKTRGGQLQHVDVTLICEKPKIKPHREAMRQRIAELCDLPLTRVSVKATTTEKLGFTGRSEGLAAQASATVKLPA
jgi:2-C-methyl-D-erythritol 4-phosphate cytidylyltransferase/2-C-methyl-D-erythritol 2,4-cyclodiphosphate synthase